MTFDFGLTLEHGDLILTCYSTGVTPKQPHSFLLFLVMIIQTNKKEYIKQSEQIIDT